MAVAIEQVILKANGGSTTPESRFQYIIGLKDTKCKDDEHNCHSSVACDKQFSASLVSYLISTFI